MERRTFIRSAGVIAGTSLLGGRLLSEELSSVLNTSGKKQNVLFIMTDQQSYTMMSCMGNTWLKTPNMDSLAKKGYRFDKTYCANPVCMPSRFSLLTGHHASDVGVKENTSAADTAKVNEIVKDGSLGMLFKNAGYETLYYGKTHLYGTTDVSEYGFDLRGKDFYDGPAIFAEKILPDLAKRKDSKPFFLFLSFMNPHDICYKAGMDKRYPNDLPEANVLETKRLLELQQSLSPEEYRSQIPPRPKNIAPINGEQPEMVSMSSGWRDWSDDQWNLYNWMYHRLTETVDRQIGRALTALKASGLEDDTIIVFTSDHGEMNGAHGLILKNVMFEESQRVPLIFVGKGIPANVVDPTTLVCNGLDFLPTICDLAGIEAPKGLQGVSLKPYLTGEGKKPSRKYIVTEDFNSFQITDGRYKLTVYELPGNPEILTDIKTNPGETVNYADDASYRQIKTELKKELMANLESRGLTPLAQDRTIKNIRKTEKERTAEKKGKKKKSNDDEE